MTFQKTFPVQDILEDIIRNLSSSPSVVLSAPPGAGKTTCVPLALLDTDWMRSKKIVMLEPRRLAARRAAEYMSALLGEKVGTTVGYRIRGDAVVSTKTRIEVVTEGILTRMLQHSHNLPETGLLIFDEFHERSIHADLGLALALDVQKRMHHDIKILVMSATIDVDAVSRLLGNAPIIIGKGKSFSVDIRFRKFPSMGPIDQQVVDTILRASENDEGDILVFLPGRKEINQVQNRLFDKRIPENMEIHCLYGDAPYQQQANALSPSSAGKRKIILSTSIAETSLTIDGVRIVVDSGLARSAQFDPRKGMSGLITVSVSKAVAEQRCGRAGRQAPGVCYRLWTELEHLQLPDYPQPEIKVTDLASFALDIDAWGDPNCERLQFIDQPTPVHLLQAQKLLGDLGATDGFGKLTAEGKMLAEIPLHPRLAYMILRGKELGLGALACELAAMLDERGTGTRSVQTIDLTERWHAIHFGKNIDKNNVEPIQRQAKRLKQIIGVEEEGKSNNHGLGILLALAYPDRIARRRNKGVNKYLLANGLSAILPAGSLLVRHEFLAVGDVDGAGNEVKIFLAAPLDQLELEKIFFEKIVPENETYWNTAEKMVVSRRISKLGALIVHEKQIEPEKQKLIAVVLDGIRQLGLSCLPWDNETRALQQRSEWFRRNSKIQNFSDTSDNGLLTSLEQWCGPFVENIKSADELKDLPLKQMLLKRYSKVQLQQMDKLAPQYLQLPSGSRVSLDYSDDQPVLAVRLQELFGQTDTPKIFNGTVSVLIHLLSPARRPLAVTKDLCSFWLKTYPEIRSQMRARYPKHIWPENPLDAKPTNKMRRKQKLSYKT